MAVVDVEEEEEEENDGVVVVLSKSAQEWIRHLEVLQLLQVRVVVGEVATNSVDSGTNDESKNNGKN
eukprot:CAMPEP_0198141954 /NCGR_PEP_ID=MMETSP1443-20131203/4867_1 /TAXON_ID=186043 /ORGANISM="Entomoneis sp., Strain CCMP2396" /LENGTH=66 /DNA_ID=CAMNT_0043804851 /DNA_START=63 /DNA_END=260 /DNA_ORIENTATION=+